MSIYKNLLSVREEKKKQEELDRIHEKMIVEVEARLDPPIYASGYTNVTIMTHSVFSYNYTNNCSPILSTYYILPQSVTIKQNQTLRDVLDSIAKGDKV
jgi:hypothetical protein